MSYNQIFKAFLYPLYTVINTICDVISIDLGNIFVIQILFLTEFSNRIGNITCITPS